MLSDDVWVVVQGACGVVAGLVKASRRGPSSVQLAPVDQTVQLKVTTAQATAPHRSYELAPETEVETAENRERSDPAVFFTPYAR